jgi:hypothetical protein
VGKDDRNAVSRIKAANLPRTSQDEATKIGPLGFVRIEPAAGVDAGKVLYLGPIGPFELPSFDLPRMK